tara:strand:+ start:199 stop:813 length:615 start_codon:yes stop_codon:yes gene_type:complete
MYRATLALVKKVSCRYYFEMSSVDNTLVLLERIGRLLQNDGHADGLKPTQWEALRYVGRANRFSRSPSALTAYLGVTKGTVSQTVMSLEKKGLIEKSGVSGDKRAVQIELTRAGKKALADDPLAHLAPVIASMSNAESARLAEGLQSLLSKLIAERGGRAFGVCKSCRYFRRNAAGGRPHLCGLLDEPLTDDDSNEICVEQEAA